MKFVLTSFILAISITGFSQATKDLTSREDSVQALVQVLREGKMIASPHVGFSGAPSRQWFGGAYLASIASTGELLALTEDTSAIIRYYGYIGLIHHDYKDIGQIREKLSKDKAEISTISGCLAYAMTLGSAIGQTQDWYNKELLSRFHEVLQQNARYRTELYEAIVTNKTIKHFPLQ